MKERHLFYRLLPFVVFILITFTVSVPMAAPAYVWHTFYGSNSDIYGGYGSSIAMDGSGNVYVTGWSDTTWNGPGGQAPLHPHSTGGIPGNSDLVVLKLNSSGQYQWHTFFGSDEELGSGAGESVAVDGSGNLYVTGYSVGTWNGSSGQPPLHVHSGSGIPGNSDLVVLKLNSSGAYQWHTFYGSNTIDGTDLGIGIAADGSGNVYVTGDSGLTWNGPAGQPPLHAHSGIANLMVLKLNTNGAYQWHTFYGSDHSGAGNGIALDSSGNVYVTGSSLGPWNGPNGELPLHASSGGGELLVVKLNSNGQYRWHTFYGSSAPNPNLGTGIALDVSGAVYVTGYSYEPWNGPNGAPPLHAHSGWLDIVVLKLDSSGTYQWHSFYGSNLEDYAYGITVDGSGNVYITGTSDLTWNGPNGEPALHAYSGWVDIMVLKMAQLQDEPVSVPTLTEWGMIIFIVLLGCTAIYYMRRQPKLQ